MTTGACAVGFDRHGDASYDRGDNSLRSKGISHAGGSSTRRARRASVFRRNVKRTEDTETVKRAHFVDPPRFSLRSALLWGSGGRQFPGSNEDAGVRLAGWSPTGGGTKISPSALLPRPSAPVRSPPDAPLVSRGRAPGRLVEILLPSLLPRSIPDGVAIWCATTRSAALRRAAAAPGSPQRPGLRAVAPVVVLAWGLPGGGPTSLPFLRTSRPLWSSGAHSPAPCVPGAHRPADWPDCQAPIDPQRGQGRGYRRMWR